MNYFIINYLVGGLIISLFVAVFTGRKDPNAFNPIVILLDPWGMILGVILWPLWVGISLIDGFGCHAFENSAFEKKEKIIKKPSSIIPCGEIGFTETALRPSGKVKMDARTVNAQTKCEYIPAGVRVVVDGHSMGNIIVKICDEKYKLNQSVRSVANDPEDPV